MSEDTAVPQDLVDAFIGTFDGSPAEVTPLEPVEPVVEQAETIAPAEETVPETPGTTDAPAEDSYRGFDPLLLEAAPPELRAALEAERKSIQAEATRKFQAASDLRKQYGEIDPELAKEAVSYMEKLADPDFLKQAHGAMTEELKRLGLSPAEAAATATQAIEDTQATGVLDDDDEFEEGTVPPQILSEINALREWQKSEIADRAKRAEADEYQRISNEALKQEAALRRDNPEWTEADITSVIGLGWTYQGDLLAAGNAYREIEQRVASRLMADKASIPSSISPPPNGGGIAAEPVKGFGSDLEAAHRAALEAWNNRAAN